ncbi:MAG: CvpA family protein, partial [Muribaculaceae bacterium]|nr:CvpA family protein [Muribaculaceae bacterium]
SVTDIVIVVIAVIAAGWGAWKGFIRQLGSFVAILLGIVACHLFGPKVAAWLEMSLVAADIVLFLVVYIAVMLMSNAIHHASRALCMGPLDRLAGGLLAIIKWAIVASLILNIWLAFDPGSKVRHGVVTPYVVKFAPRLLGYVTDYLNHNA